jgi:hypothetical protein
MNVGVEIGGVAVDKIEVSTWIGLPGGWRSSSDADPQRLAGFNIFTGDSDITPRQPYSTTILCFFGLVNIIHS